MSTTDTTSILIQQADTDSLFNLVFDIRTKVFVEESAVNQEDEYDGFDHISNHYLAWYKDKPAGTARWRMLPSGSRVRLERFAVLKEYRGLGIGTALVKALLQVVPSVDEIFVHPQLENIVFFKKWDLWKMETYLKKLAYSTKRWFINQNRLYELIQNFIFPKIKHKDYLYVI